MSTRLANSNRPAVRRVHSTTRATTLQNRNMRLNLNKSGSDVDDLENLVNDKIKKSVENLNTARNTTIEAMEEKIKKISEAIDGVEMYKEVAEKAETKYSELYKEYCVLERRYEILRQRNEDQFFKYQCALNAMQSQLFKFSVSSINTELLNNQEKEKMSAILNDIENLSDNTSISSNEIEITEITNPLVSHRNAPPIMKKNSSGSLRKKSGDIDPALKQLLEGENDE